MRLGIDAKYLERLLPFWLAVLIIGSFLPSEAKQAIGTTAEIRHGRIDAPGLAHRLWHFGSFGATALLVSLVNRNPGKRILFVVSIAVLGLCIELMQARLTGFVVEWWDVRDDALGVAVFMALGQLRGLRSVVLRNGQSRV